MLSDENHVKLDGLLCDSFSQIFSDYFPVFHQWTTDLFHSEIKSKIQGVKSWRGWRESDFYSWNK